MKLKGNAGMVSNRGGNKCDAGDWIVMREWQDNLECVLIFHNVNCILASKPKIGKDRWRISAIC